MSARPPRLPRALHRLLRLLALAALLAVAALRPGWAAQAEGDITLLSQYWIDGSGRLSVDEVDGGAAQLQPMDRHRAFSTGEGALWMRLDYLNW